MSNKRLYQTTCTKRTMEKLKNNNFIHFIIFYNISDFINIIKYRIDRYSVLHLTQIIHSNQIDFSTSTEIQVLKIVIKFLLKTVNRNSEWTFASHSLLYSKLL